MLAVADIGALVKLGIVVIVVAGWIVRAIATQAAEKQVARPRPAQPQPRLPQSPRQPAAPGPAAQRPLDPAEEVAEFLRQAQARRSGSTPSAAMPPAAAPPAAPPARRQRQPVSPPRMARPSKRPPAIPQQRAGDQLTDLAQGVGQHVRQHVDTREFEQRAARPTRVAVAEAANEARLQGVFSHRVGTLADATLPSGDESTPAPAPALSIAALLTDGSTLRQMVVINEILRRPEEHW
ncbi:MAG: hypothetical protein K2Y37_15645 [Pirellulales bacterium]|nr:hypothetical protein [Pirellulales bacterium]